MKFINSFKQSPNTNDKKIEAYQDFILSELKCVKLRVNFYNFGDEFNHLVAHALSCTFESEDVSVMGYK